MTRQFLRHSRKAVRGLNPSQKSGTKGACYAALDLGTNSCRMLVAQPEGEQFKIVDAFSKSVLLGQGLEHSGVLNKSAIRRTIVALRTCNEKLKKHNVKRARLIATAACRQAENGTAFLKQVKRETGLDLELISPQEEARLAVIGCAPLVEKTTDNLLVVDIGGGSTELVWINLCGCTKQERIPSLMSLNWTSQEEIDKCQAKVLDWISVPIGVSTLEQQFSDVEDDAARFALMSCSFEEQLEDFGLDGSEIGDGSRFQVIGTSGTMTTLAASHLGLNKYSREAVDGCKMTASEVNKIVEGYLRLGPKGRGQEPCIGKSRSELIMSGCAIVQAIMRSWPTQNLTVADRGLREGLLYSEIAKDR